jgi:NSS family neurotransmitter:Na+ symporter
VWYVSHRNLEKGIGMVSKILIPALFTFMLIIIIYSLTLPGHMIGIDNLLRPNWSTLWDINIWIGAFAQILFSLSMGQAIAYTYASYLPEDSRFTNDIFLVVTANSLFEIFTAFGIFSVLGYMSLHSGLRLSSLISEGTGLVFEVFPTIFNIMGPFARILAPLLFLSIFFAGITSALGIFEPMLSSTMHKFNLSRRKATTILATIGCLISITFTTGIGSYLVGIVDMFINQFGVLFLIGLQCVIFTWFYKVEDLIPVINEHGFINVSKKWIVIIKYILPILIFGMWIYGLLDLFIQANGFELFVDMTIVIVVLVFGFILTRFKPKQIES